MTPKCAHQWQRSTTEDVDNRSCAYRCELCGHYGWKRVGESDAFIRAASQESMQIRTAARSREANKARDLRFAEDAGAHTSEAGRSKKDDDDPWSQDFGETWRNPQ